MFPNTTVVGDQFRFRIVAFNIQGNVTSLASDPMTLASVPDTPTIGPTNDASLTNTMQIGVTYNEITGDGGSPILSYEL